MAADTNAKYRRAANLRCLPVFLYLEGQVVYLPDFLLLGNGSASERH